MIRQEIDVAKGCALHSQPAAALVRAAKRPALIVESNELAAQRMTEDLNLLLDGGARNLPARDISFLKTAASSRELSIRRIEALGDCVSGKAAALVVSADCLQHRLMPPERFSEYVIDIDETMRMEPSELIDKLVQAGYERVQMVEGRGQCALRGGILDVYPVGEVNALRIEFFDDEVDSIRSFDVMTQRSIARREAAEIFPAAEVLLSGEEAVAAGERLRQLGDIVTANLWQMQRGQVRLTATDFYDPEMRQIDIPLSPKLSPQQNAAKFYKDYAKAKTAQRVLTEQIAQGRTEEDYLASVLETIARAECERDLAEIRTELELGGYLRRGGKRSQPKTAPAKPMEFCSSDGFYIYVGRNNRQNDQLTLKLAYKSDLWLHTQKIHGSHVIISCHGQTPPDRTVTEAMMLAAYYSQAREGQGVPVDYTPVRFVKKPGGAKPGMVVYTTYRTGYVTPDAQLVERLRAK